LLSRAAAKTAIAAIFKSDEADPIGDEPAETLDAEAQCATVTMEVQDHRLGVARRNVPSDDANAICCGERHFGSFAQSRSRRRDMHRVGKIHQRALREINDRRQGDVTTQCDDGDPTNYQHCARAGSGAPFFLPEALQHALR
jgi:hypothetical protein